MSNISKELSDKSKKLKNEMKIFSKILETEISSSNYNFDNESFLDYKNFEILKNEKNPNIKKRFSDNIEKNLNTIDTLNNYEKLKRNYDFNIQPDKKNHYNHTKKQSFYKISPIKKDKNKILEISNNKNNYNNLYSTNNSKNLNSLSNLNKNIERKIKNLKSKLFYLIYS